MKRSIALNNWIRKHSNSEALIRSMPTLPANLREELLAEAFAQHPEIKSFFDDFYDDDYGIRELQALIEYCRTKEVWQNNSCRIPGMKMSNTPILKLLDYSRLFCVRIPGVERHVCSKEVIACNSRSIVEYTGEVLYEFEWDVWHALITISNGEFDYPHQTTTAEILKIIGMARSGAIYRTVDEALQRLNAAALMIHANNSESVECVRLVERISKVPGGNIEFELNPMLGNAEIMGKPGFVDWSVRNGISKNWLAKRLQILFSGSKNMQTFYLTQLRDACRVDTELVIFNRKLPIEFCDSI